MRILIATTHRSVVGGVETYLRALLPLLRNLGHEIGLLCANPGAPGKPAIDEECPGLAVWIAPGRSSALASAEVWRPEVVYTHELPDLALEAAFLSRFPTVLYAHNYGGTCVSGSKCHAFPRWQPCSRKLGLGCLGLYFPRRCGGLNPVTALKLYRDGRARQLLLAKYRRVLVASRHMVGELVRNGVAPERVVLNPFFPPGNSPDLAPPAPRPQSGRVLFVGRLTALKGWRFLLEAVPQAAAALKRPLTLVVAGDGPDRQQFEAEAKGRSVSAEFLGWIGPEQREKEMRAADVLAVPSVWPEPFGLVGIEAGYLGLPAVGFAVGGIPDWLTPGVSGELAPGDRPGAHELAAALVRALAYEPHWNRLRVGAWEKAGLFTPAAHLDCLLSVFKAAIDEAPC